MDGDVRADGRIGELGHSRQYSGRPHHPVLRADSIPETVMLFSSKGKRFAEEQIGVGRWVDETTL